MSDFQQTITSLDLLHTSLYRMELFMNAQAVKNAKTDVISLISRLEKAERERDEAIAAHRKHAASLIAGRGLLRERAEAAEAELARRDAAAGEPVAWVCGDEEIRDFKSGREVTIVRDCDDSDLEYLPLYTAAPPAVLPDAEREMWRNNLKDAGHALSDIRRFVEEKFKCVADLPSNEAVSLAGPEVKHESDAIISALNRVAEFYELGGQQQKVVVLEDVESEAILNAWDYQRSVFNSLDAANVKWEVKK